MIAALLVAAALVSPQPEALVPPRAPIVLHWQPRLRLGFSHAEPGATVYQATIGLTRPLATRGPLARVLIDVEAGRYRFPLNVYATTYGASFIITLGRQK
jgi:hypothetical protein